MTILSLVSCYLMKKSNSETKTAGDNFTDKRFFTDKPLIKTKNDFLSIVSCYLMKKSNFETKTACDNFTDKRVFTDKPLIKTENDYL